MAFILDPQTGKISFGVVADSTHDAIARDIAQEFGVSENFKDNFSTYLNQVEADTAWLPQDTPDNQVDVTNDNFFFTVKRDGTNTSVSHDLGAGNVSDTQWVLRCKVNIGSPYVQTGVLSSGLNISITDGDSSVPLGSENDLIQTGLINTIVGGGAQHAINNLDNGAGGSSTTGTTTGWVAGETIYVELKRESSTSIRSTIFTDASYTIIRDTIVKTIPSTIVGLRFIKFGSATDVTGFNGTFTGTVDDIQFWNGITVPVITSQKFKMRFELDITTLTTPSGNDVSMWVSLSDSDETFGSNDAQDAFSLAVFVDNVLNRFNVQTSDNQSPRTSGTDQTMATLPAVGTFFVEMIRDQSQTTVNFYTDNTFTTISETKTQAGISGTDNLKYLKLFNDEVPTNGNEIDGTFDNFTFDDLVMVGDATLKPFIVDAILIVSQFTCGDKIIFQDDFSTATNWVQTGTQVTIAGGEIQGWGPDSTTQRLTHDLVTPLSDKSWTVEFEFETSSFANPAHDILVLTDTNTNSAGLQDHIAVRFGFSGGLIQFGILRGDNNAIGSGAILPVTASINTRYFVRLQRITRSIGRLTVFTGGFDSVLFGTVDVDLVGGLGGDITGLQFVISETSVLGGAGRTLTGIIDNLVITNACCNFETDSELVEVSPTWQYREHELNLAVPPASTFQVEVASPNRFEMITGPPGIANNYVFKVFKKSEITGSDVDIIWEKTDNCTECTSHTFRVIDGSYDKDSLTDFVPGAGSPTSKGGGVLGSFSDFSNHAERKDILTGINWGASVLDDVTVIAFITDTNTSPFGTLQVKEINIRGTDNGQNFKWEFLSPVVTTETTGTDQDAGYVNASSATASVTKSICGIDLTDLKAYWNFDEVSGALINQATAVGSVDSLGTPADGTVGALIDRQQVGQVSDSYLFQGLTESQVSNRIVIGSSASQFNFLHTPNSVGTVNVWVNPGASYQAFETIMMNQTQFSTNTGFLMSINNGFISVRPRAPSTELLTTVISSTQIPLNQFTMVTAVWDELTGVDLFYDGVFIENFPRAVNSASSGDADFAMNIGTFAQTQAGLTLDGNLDETSIWARKLTPVEINTLFLLGNGGIALQVGGASCVTVDALLQLPGAVKCAGGNPFFLDPIGGNSSLWTSNTGAIVIDSGGSGVLEWNNLAGGATTTERFAFRAIPNFADNLGEIRIRVKVDKISDSAPINPSGRFMVLQNNALHPNPATGSSFGFTIGGGSPNGSLSATIDDGTNNVTTTPRPTFLNGTTKFLEAIYDPVGQTLTLNIYTDANFTIHDTGSPIQVDASTVSMTGLTFTHMVTSNVKNSGPARVITADLDDFQIGGTASCPSPQVDALLKSLGDNGCHGGIFQDDFATNTNWTQVGTGVSVTGGEIQGWGADGTDRRVHHDLGTPLNDNGWKAEFECEFSFFSSGFFSPNHELFQATDTQAPETTDKDLIGVKFGQSNNLNNFGIYVDDHTPSTLPIVVNPTIASTGVRYFVRLERLSPTEVKMSIFTGGFDVTPFGTPVSATIPSTITGLQFIQSSNNNNGSSSRVLTGVLDNLVITNNCPTFTIDARLVVPTNFDFTVDAIIKRFGDVLCAGGQGVFHQEDFTTNTGWTNSNTTLIRIDEPTFPNVLRIVNLHPTTQGLQRAVKALDTPFIASTDYVWEFKHIHLAGGTGFASEFTIELKETSANAGGGASATETTIRYRTDVIPSSGPERLRLEVFDNNGINGILSPEGVIVLQDNFTYYPRITKTGNIVKLELFTDVDRTTQETGSPTQVDITGFDMSQDLGFIYVGNYDTGGSARLANEELDDIIVLNSTCPRFQVDALLFDIPDAIFTVDAFIFILPVFNVFVDALLKAFNQEKDFTIDSCLRVETREEFEIDACLQIEDTDELFTVDALIFILPVRLFLVDAIIRYAQGTITSPTGGIPDLIIRVLRENPPSLTGLQIIDEIVKITSDPAEGFSFRGKTSRIKNWLNRLRIDGLIIDDGSNPDWYRTNWSLNPAVFP